MTAESKRIEPKIEDSWRDLLKEDFNSEPFFSLKQFLVEERRDHAVYPPGGKIFKAFNLTPLPKVKVVILGQDPYHGPGQAHGLCFSVQDGVPFPPSLRNIFKEIQQEFGFELPESGNLEKWARQGVLLLNATLTVRAHQAGSHQKRGWEEFTDSVIRKISESREGVVFLLWGRFAKNKASLIDGDKHLVLTAAHPSPLSAHNGFFGCGHFSKANEYLKKRGEEAIDWDLNHA